MSYCRWIASKQILDFVPSLCYLQNGAATSRAYTTLQRNHFDYKTKTSSTTASSSDALQSANNDLLKKYSEIAQICLRQLHNSIENPLPTSKNKELYDKTVIFQDFVQETPSSLTPEDVENKDYDEMSRVFPNPKETLNNLKTMVDPNFLEILHKPKVEKKGSGKKIKQSHLGWKTSVRLTWPETMIFEGEGKNKTQSSHKAALKAVHWLYVNRHVDDQGYPIYSDTVVKKMRKEANRPAYLHINFEEETIINNLYKDFTSKVEPFIRSANATQNQETYQPAMPQDLNPTDHEDLVDLDVDKPHGNNNSHGLKLAYETEYYNPIYGSTAQDKDQAELKERSGYLKRKLKHMRPEKSLPIQKYREQIIEAINDNRAVVIRGAPGCGKSTRVPSYILNEWITNGKGAECNVIVSQPRRVAALSLASRVALERGDHQVGDTVGHQVRLQTRLPSEPGGGILYCTAGALLRRIASSPGLPGCTHLVLDEAHERSADCDVVMTLSKRALDLNPNLKVIIMSATIDTHLFSRYYNDCPILDIPGFTFPVESFYLNDIRRLSNLQLPKTTENTFLDSERASVNSQEVVEVIRWIHKTKPDGAILVFLPGWETIKKVKGEMEESYNDGSWVVLPVHSRLSNEEQKRIFDKPMGGLRKIVLATNIAETSITIDDVVYVVDTGVHKEHRLMAGKGISSLDNDWISQASVAQRRGRAGRVMAGECYHMYSKEKMKSFVDNNLPEILRIPLEKTVLDCKTYNEDVKALDFLGNFPQPPSPAAIRVAIEDLINMGAIDRNECLTPLGRRIASYTTHPKISKALVYATIFKVTSPIVDLSAIISNNVDMFSCSGYNRHISRDLKTSFHPTSDHLAMYWLCQKYSEMKSQKPFFEIMNYCKRNNIRSERLNSVFDLRKICLEHLKQSRMLSPYVHEASHNVGEEDEFSSIDELVKGVLLSGLNTLLTTKYSIKTRGKLSKEKGLVSDQGQRAFLSQTSVNFNITKKDMDALMVYCGAVHSQERRGILVREVSLVHPLTAFLFSQKVDIQCSKDGKTKFQINSPNISLECDEEQAECLQRLRKMMWSMADYYIQNKGFNDDFNTRDPRLDYARHRAERRIRDRYGDEEEDALESTQRDGNPMDPFRNSLVAFLAELLNKVEIVSHEAEKSDGNDTVL